MDNGRKASISAAIIVLVCFFLPWIQVSCGAAQDTATGIDLARQGHSGLWLIPLLMLAVIFFNVARRWQTGDSRGDISALVSLLAGVVSVYLMNRERLRAEEASGLVAVRLTGWFWLGFGSSIATAGLAAARLLKRPKPS